MEVDARQVFQALLRQSLSAFVAKVFQMVSPGDRFLHTWHLDVMADRLQQCARGTITRLIITVPPRSLKSIFTSVAFPAWVLGHDPTRRIICASYAAELATKFARDSRAVMDSTWYRQLFPQTRLRRHAELDLETTRKGRRYATSVGGTLTGLGGSLLIIDDPLKPQEALSKAKREAVNTWYDNTLYSRLDNKATDVIILVMQRLHVDDLVAHVRQQEDWHVLELPAVAECEEVHTLSDGRQFRRVPGEALHPERESLELLDTIKATIGTGTFSSQYQQRPIPEEGCLIQRKWIQTYAHPPSLSPGDWIVQSWDTASKATELAGYSVCTTWHVKGPDYYLLDVYRKRLDFPALKRAVIEQARTYHPHHILMEDTASGTALIQDLQYHHHDGVPRPIAVTPQGDKVMRLATQSPTIEAGHMWFPRQAPWMEDFWSELLAFPQSRYDDQVDSLSQFLTWIQNRQRQLIRVVKLQGL